VKKPLKIILASLVVVGLALTAGPFLYINLIRDDAPDALTIDDDASDQTIPAGQETAITDVNGAWQVAPNTDSVVGYRVKEVLFGQSTEGVGRTGDITADLMIVDNVVTEGSFTVQMGTILSDAANRDRQFNGRIMDTTAHPTATFVLRAPVTLPTNALSGEVLGFEATGDLTLRGNTKSVTFPLQAKVEGAVFTVVGNITIVFDEWGIPEPDLPGISVEPEGLLEFSLVFNR
jgi:polyisoprenoid-binding protein YceI